MAQPAWEEQNDGGGRGPEVQRTTSIHQTTRQKKAVESNVLAIENRIAFFQREEEKIWRDLEEVRRQASTIEEGRSRVMEKKVADGAIQQAREMRVQQNKSKASSMKQASVSQRNANQYLSVREKQIAGQEQRKASQDFLRQKRYDEAQRRLANSERAVAIQRSQLEARLRANDEKAKKLDGVRMQQEKERASAELEVQEVEARLPGLEAEEMLCLQRLQNSRMVTQNVLEELEESLGTRSSVSTLLRARQRQQEQYLDGVQEASALEN